MRVAVAAVLVLAVVSRLFLIWRTHATEEDFYITLRYAQNLAQGAGFVYNTGEHVLGTTTPLYTLLLALAIRLHLDPALFGKLLCVAADAGSCWFAWRLGCALGRPFGGLGAALCLAVAPLNLIEGVKGMEASLVACACIGAWSLLAEGKTIGAWVCAGLVTLLRVDGALLAAILLAACIAMERRAPWRGLLVYAALTLPWFVYAAAVFGSPVPASLHAKLVVYGWHRRTLLPNVAPFLSVMTHNSLSLLILAGVVAAAVGGARRWLNPDHSSAPDGHGGPSPPMRVSRIMQVGVPQGPAPDDTARRRRIVIGAMAAWLLLYYGGMAFSKVFLFGWYFLPPSPAYYLIGCLGWEDLLGRMRDLRPARAWKTPTPAAVIACLVAAGLLMAAVMVPRAERTLRESQRVEDELRIPIGVWLGSHASPGDTVMLEPIGYIGYYSGLRVLDTVGLVSPQVLPFYGRQERSPYHALWKRFRPEWVLMRSGEWEELLRAERQMPAADHLEAQYRLVTAWQSPGAGPDSAPAFLLFRRAGEYRAD